MTNKNKFLLLCGVITALFFNSLFTHANNCSQSSKKTIINKSDKNVTKNISKSLIKDAKIAYCPLLNEGRTYCYLEGEILNTPKETSKDKQLINVDNSSSNKDEETTPSRGGNITYPETGNSIKMSSDERYWLGKLIEAESADEPFQGKLAVANVIANRVGNSEFGLSVNDVIRGKNQFSPWQDGSIYRRTASEDTKKAISEVFDYGIRILSNDAMFFTSKAVKNDWVPRTRKFIIAIGNQNFYSIYEK